jgi:hypothetical protein
VLLKVVAYRLRGFFKAVMLATLSAGRENKMAENIFTITSGDNSTAQQYSDTFRRSEHLEPEKALVAAILEDAVHEYRKYSRARDAKGKERFRAAEKWIMHRGNDWIFSFDNVCDLLRLDPEYVRRGLRETKAKHAEEEPEHRHGMHGRAA